MPFCWLHAEDDERARQARFHTLRSLALHGSGWFLGPSHPPLSPITATALNWKAGRERATTALDCTDRDASERKRGRCSLPNGAPPSGHLWRHRPNLGLLPHQYCTAPGTHSDGAPLRRMQSPSAADHLYSFPRPPHSTASDSASSTTALPETARKQTSLARIAVPSFSAFRAQVSSIPIAPPTVSASRRRPLQLSQPSPRSFSFAAEPSPRLIARAGRPFSLDTVLSPPLPADPGAHHPSERASRAPRQSAHERSSSIDSRVAGVGAAPATGTSSRSSIPLHERYSDARSSLHRPRHSTSSIDFTNRSSALGGNGVRRLSMTGSELRPSMTLEVNGVQRTLSSESLSTDSSGKHQPSRIGALFGWKGSSPHRPGSESPTTTYSDRSLSPAPSPRLGKHGLLSAPGSMARLTPPGLDIHKANSHESRFFHHPETPILIGTPEMNAHVQELERELAQVSSELAGSIRREIDLEDEIDRLKFEPPNLPASELGRRGSDYFSDSGASFTKFPISDPEAKIEEVERLRRKAEQEKAQLKLDTAQKLQTELGRRRDLEQLVQSLEDQLERRNLDDGVTRDFNEKLEELESTLEETRRRLAQEKEAKENFEDLYSALQVDLEQSRTERDSLRDEVIPQLKARLDVFETEPSKSSFGAQRAKDGSQSRFRSIAEESDDFSTTAGSGFGGSRAGSLARSSSKRGGSLSRSGSFKERSEGGGRQRSGSVGVTAEGVREVEDQRDALHQALKLLISRYEKQRKDHERTLKNLARENAAAQRKAAAVPQKGSQYQRELSALKDEVTTLRKRTEDALEQKWQYEKSLGGIKMDLDRAEHETRGLRSLLHEHDILAPSPRTLRGPSFENPLPTDESSRGSISTAETERDLARRLAEEFRQRAEALQKTRDPDPEGQSRRLAELLDAAKRMDDLAQQFDQQVSNNLVLRKRLADAIDKGEREQRQSTQQIEEMQKRLAGMEDSVLAAQQHSETTLTVHESEVRRIEEATSPRLQRLTVHIPEPSKLRAVITPGLKPRSRSTDSRKAKVSEASLLDASRTHMLERKVRELERLLGDAEDDMQLVVQRVNRSQLEVAELTTERDAALAQMRKLQDKFVDETERAEALMHDSRQAGRSPR